MTKFSTRTGYSHEDTGEPYLVIRLTGPDALERLDELHVSILDDDTGEERPGHGLPNVGGWLWSASRFVDTVDDGRSARPRLNGVIRTDWIVYHLTFHSDPRPVESQNDPKWKDVVNDRRVKIEIAGTLRTPGGGRDHVWRWQGAVSIYP